MWYLDSSLKYILLIATIYIFISFINNKWADCFKKTFFPFIFLLFLFNYNFYSGLFYLVLTFMNFFFSISILKTSKHKKPIFVTSIAINIILFLAINIYPYLNIDKLDFLSFIGFSYAFLKFVDLLYYAYYYEEDMSLIDVINYILFIPVFTSGPIMLFNDYKKQINTPQSEIAFLDIPIKRIITGFSKKVILVRLLYVLHDNILDTELNFLSSFIILFLFYCIGYLDFSGYSDIAIGFSKLMGIYAPENFKMPFLSPSLTIFWKNWHISLGTWIKGHISVFIKPKNRLQSGLSSFLIMLFIGIWHKFSFLFFLWGVWHGIFLFIEAYFNLGIVNKKKTKPLVYYIRCLITNIIVILGCLFFYTDMDVVMKILKGFISF